MFSWKKNPHKIYKCQESGLKNRTSRVLSLDVSVTCPEIVSNWSQKPVIETLTGSPLANSEEKNRNKSRQ